LRFRPPGEKPVFKLHLQVETWFWKVFRGACNRFWNILLREDTQVWENDVLMITGLQAYKTTGDALRRWEDCFPGVSVK
jgi:hypothetical protein